MSKQKNIINGFVIITTFVLVFVGEIDCEPMTIGRYLKTSVDYITPGGLHAKEIRHLRLFP